MPPDIERMLTHPEPLFRSMDPKYDMLYPLASSNAFKTVNAIVFYMLSRLDPGVPVERDEVEGGTVYYLLYRTWLIQLFVLHVSDTIACIRLHNCIPIGNREGFTREYSWRPPPPHAEYTPGITGLMMGIHQEIVSVLRYPIQMGLETAPPMPPASEMAFVFQWQQLYRPNMTDKELADQLGVSHQTVRNARSKYQQTKREIGRVPQAPRGYHQHGRTRGRKRLR